MSFRKILAGCLLAALAACAIQPAEVRAAAGEVAQGVYFLGVDQLPAGEEGGRVAALFAANPQDRWALTDTVKRIAAELGAQSIGLDAPIDRWDPANDPYNFGLITLRGASHRTLTWEGASSRTHVSLDLTWLQVGHDQRTRMQGDKLPELRFTVSLHKTTEHNSDRPPGSADLQGYYRQAFVSAVRELLPMVRARYGRDLDRSAADLRYLVVTPPVVLPAAAQQLAGLLDTQRLSEATASYIEHTLMREFAADAAFDRVVLLPNARAADYLQAEWSSFARRVAALSSYSAAWQATGFRPPRLLRAVPLCVEPGEDQVHALEIRSNLADVRWQTAPDNPLVEWVTLAAFLAADIKLPLDGKRSRQPMPDELPPVQRNSISSQKKPVGMEIKTFVGAYAVQMAVAKAVDPLAVDLARRLREVLRNTETLSHPSYQGFCRET